MAKTDKIGIDLKGRVNRLRLAERNMLLPVFEAVVNSIHAIEDTKISDGKIEIEIKRTAQVSLEMEGRSLPEVIGFKISDNGIGFNEDNYESFKREYSTHKANRGGLGIGRFMWLRSEEHTSELQSRPHLVCRLLLEKKNYDAGTLDT